MLVAADVYRPAAIEQLKVVGKNLNIPVHFEDSNDPIKICENSIGEARNKSCDLLILDTAGRLHIDDMMMQELENIKDKVKPHEILFVADGMTGQDAVNTANEFCSRLEFDGIVLTKLDGDTRGGAALSIRSVTQKPIKFISIGEKFEADIIQRPAKNDPNKMVNDIINIKPIQQLDSSSYKDGSKLIAEEEGDTGDEKMSF